MTGRHKTKNIFGVANPIYLPKLDRERETIIHEIWATVSLWKIEVIEIPKDEEMDPNSNALENWC